MNETKSPSIFHFKTLKWIVTCLLVGGTVLFFLPGQSSIETDLFIPVVLDRIPLGLTAGEGPAKGIEVRIRGPKSIIEGLHRKGLQYRLDLKDTDIGVQLIPIKPDRIPLPREVSVLRATPSLLQVRIERELSKQLPVIISFSGKPASGFFVSEAIAKPASVIVRGAENVLAPIDKAPTKPLDVTGLSESFKKEIALDLPASIEIIAPSEGIVGQIILKEKIVQRKFSAIAVEGENTEMPFTITPPVMAIEIKGPVNMIETLLATGGIKAMVDLKGLKPGVYVRRAVLKLPVPVSLVSVDPEIFTVRIMEK